MAAVASQWRSNLKPVNKPIQTTSPRRKPAALEIPKLNQLNKTWPPKENSEAKSPRAATQLTPTTPNSTSPTSKWSYLSATSRIATTPRKKTENPQPKTTGRITADELLSREFTPVQYSARHRSSVFLRTVEVFEGEIPGRLKNNEDPRQALAEEKLDFCSKEMVDMQKFIEQIEEDFLSMRKRIDFVKYTMEDLKSESKEMKMNGDPTVTVVGENSGELRSFKF